MDTNATTNGHNHHAKPQLKLVFKLNKNGSDDKGKWTLSKENPPEEKPSLKIRINTRQIHTGNAEIIKPSVLPQESNKSTSASNEEQPAKKRKIESPTTEQPKDTPINSEDKTEVKHETKTEGESTPIPPKPKKPRTGPSLDPGIIMHF